MTVKELREKMEWPYYTKVEFILDEDEEAYTRTFSMKIGSVREIEEFAQSILEPNEEFAGWYRGFPIIIGII